MYNILWGRWELKEHKEHPAHRLLRKQARSEGWVGVAGYKEFVKEQYNGKLYVNKNGDITGIGFKLEEDATLFALSVENERI